MQPSATRHSASSPDDSASVGAQIDAADLVPGDVVLVRLGDVVPADIKLLGEGGEHDTPMQVRSRLRGRVGLG